MQLWVRRVVALASLFVLAAVAAGTASAQGVTSASITGRVAQEGGNALEGATVVVTNTSTGQRFQVVSRAGGRFALENLPPGGPYTVEVRAIGYQAGRRTGVRLELGQRYASDFSLKAAVVEVQEIVVQGAQDALINRGRTGSASTVSSTAIATLPSANRNFTDLINTSPQVVAAPGGSSPTLGGANNRFNSIQIDGSVNNDLFGLGSSGAPGGQNGGRPISMDAVQEFQVLVAPFDVRQGGFTGGLVNAITKSGTNTYEGSAFLFYQNDALVSNWPHPTPDKFDILQFGATFGGPIVRDRAHFFVSVERQTSTTPFGGSIAGVDFDTNSVTGGTDKCNRMVAAITALGGDAGSCGGFDVDNPNTNLFAKVTSSAGQNGQIEFSLNYAESNKNFFARSSTFDYQLTNGFYEIHNTNITPRLKWTNIFNNRFNNELLLGYQRIRDRRDPVSSFPTIKVISGAYSLVTGAEENSQANSLDQDVWELTDNVSFDVGLHRLTVGTHNEFFGFNNVFFPRSTGVWIFNGIDSLEAGNARSFERNLTGAQAGIAGGRADGPTADFEVRQFGLYAQDQWSPTANLTLTFGLRADIPTFPLTPPTNPSIKNVFGIDTGVFPSGNTLWSPRLGFNYDMGGRGDLVIRGGAGVFSGRPPYVWVSNAFANSGLEQARLFCNNTTTAITPNFNNFGLDPDGQPTTCAGGNTPGAAVPDINFFDKDFQFPQTLRASVGMDKKLPWDLVASADFTYSNTFKSLYINDVNLQDAWNENPTNTLAGEGGRILYGNVTGGTVVPTRVNAVAARYVLGHWNRGVDYSYSAVFQVQKRMSDMVELNAGYNYSRAYDLMSLTSSVALSNYGFAALDGTLADRNLRPAYFDRPHSIKLSGLVHLPYNIDFSMTYVGVSGSPYAYVVNGDANGDGVGASTQKNDLFYVPTDINDLSWTLAIDTVPALKAAKWDSLDNYINSESCLNSQRGRVMERTSCRNPWLTQVNARLAWSVATYRGQRLELTADVFNVLHLINNEWGIQKLTSFNETTNIVRRTGYDATGQRNRYDLALPIRQATQRTDSRSRILLGGRYTF
jgi:outer membrane receptor protein involved in Fe transport